MDKIQANDYPVDVRKELENFSGPNMESPELSAAFFASAGTIAIGDSLLVKRYTNGTDDTVHILRINKEYNGSRFRFPAMFISTVSERLKKILEGVSQDLDGEWKLSGLETTSSYDDLSSDEFWKDNTTIKVVNFHLKPYLTKKNKLMFRLWNAVGPEHQKVYENAKGNVIWKGPVASLTMLETKRLAVALEQLSKAKPETA